MLNFLLLLVLTGLRGSGCRFLVTQVVVLLELSWIFSILSLFDHGVFFASMVVLHKSHNKLWEVVVMYGPADHSLSQLFLDELSIKVSASTLPLLIGGDFNLLHSPNDKNNSMFS